MLDTTSRTLSLSTSLFNATATTEIYTLSLHDALPIYGTDEPLRGDFLKHAKAVNEMVGQLSRFGSEVTHVAREVGRSEEHTSELQSQSNLVCRLLLEKKKINIH